MSFRERVELVKPISHHLNKNLIGIEREGLRVAKDGGIAQSAHPKSLGCPLTHVNITTDFSEALIEIVTDPNDDIDGALEQLKILQAFVIQNLENEEYFWHNSMPCVIRGETNIPIANYGKSNRGMMKTVYRRGLAERYGAIMQTIAGIHFNYSFSQNFWSAYHEANQSKKTLRDFVDAGYIGTARNLVRYGWIVTYLFGASPAICRSFLKGYLAHHLEDFDVTTLYDPLATSLRMGDIGYQNLKEDEAGVKANYNSLSHYIASLNLAMNTTHKDFDEIGMKRGKDYIQLNNKILQIENEYYASVRPKPKNISGQKPLDLLEKNGIEYIELRSLDINPLTQLGIDKEQILFLESFILYCLLELSPPISTIEQYEIDQNNQKVAHSGRDSNLLLKRGNDNISLKDFGKEISIGIIESSKILSQEHHNAVGKIIERFDHPEMTPSGQILKIMMQKDQGFFEFTKDKSDEIMNSLKEFKISNQDLESLTKQSDLSCEAQKQIESEDKISFGEYLKDYFSK